MSMPDRIYTHRQYYNSRADSAGTWSAERSYRTDMEYTRTALIAAELEECCDLVTAAGLSTGHGESHVELIKEVLNQVRNMRKP